MCAQGSRIVHDFSLRNATHPGRSAARARGASTGGRKSFLPEAWVHRSNASTTVHRRGKVSLPSSYLENN